MKQLLREVTFPEHDRQPHAVKQTVSACLAFLVPLALPNAGVSPAFVAGDNLRFAWGRGRHKGFSVACSPTGG